VTNVQESELVSQGSLPPDSFEQSIERISEIAQFDLEVANDLLDRLKRETNDMLIDENTLIASATALSVGHLVLQGPPGTGKSALARALCRAYECSFLPVTAHEDWTTYEVIGRQTIEIDEHGREHVIPVNGFFTDAVIRCASAIVRHFDEPAEPQACWLLIDELNRAHLDKAFGELFTVLGTDKPVAITLPYQSEGNRELVTPTRFRIIATLNSVDRQFINSLSQGLKRRFTFITLDVPPPRSTGEAWDNTADDASLASREFLLVLRRAAERVARRLVPEGTDDLDTKRGELIENFLSKPYKAPVTALFDTVEAVRYSRKGNGKPYLPVGTAQLIDVVELYFSRIATSHIAPDEYAAAMDWAASVKVAPLFDTDTVLPVDLEEYARNLPAPFSGQLRRELLGIVASGLYYVE
jgi:5-methylcytosine-specific restriction enzyme B